MWLWLENLATALGAESAGRRAPTSCPRTKRTRRPITYWWGVRPVAARKRRSTW